MNALLYALANLARLRWLGAAFCALAIVCTTANANAIAPGTEDEQTKTRVGGFEQNPPLNVCANALASAETHLGISSVQCEAASAFSHAAEGGAATLYTAIDSGPLPEAIANTFRGGSYTATTLSDTTTLYRAYGGTAGELGSFWSRVAPSGPFQAMMDSALNPAWGNTAANVATIQVPAGTMIYEGTAAAQGGLLGGGSQVFIPTVNPQWIIP